MAVSKTDDRRKYTRVGFVTRIEISLQTCDRPETLTGDSRDLSLKGLFVRTDKRFDPGTDCDVTLYLSGGIEPIELGIKGTVVRKTAAGIGIVFNAMDVDTYAHLKKIVQYNDGVDAV